MTPQEQKTYLPTLSTLWETAELQYCARNDEGYIMTVVLTELGHYCGYVTVPNTHIACVIEATAIFSGFFPTTDYLHVHGGITYSRAERGPNSKLVGWTFGFDCAHTGDSNDPASPLYKDFSFARANCVILRQSLKEIPREVKHRLNHLNYHLHKHLPE